METLEQFTGLELIERGLAKATENEKNRKELFPALSSPSSHTLQECFAELKVGRTRRGSEVSTSTH